MFTKIAILAICVAVAFASGNGTAPAGTTGPSTNGVIVTLTEARTWSSLRYDLRDYICGITCPGYGPDLDFYVQGLSSSSVSSTTFAVSCNNTGMMYELLGLPTAVLADAKISTVAAAVTPPALDQRGPNQLKITIRYTNYKISVYGVDDAYMSFYRYQDNMMDRFTGRFDNNSHMTLINSTGFVDGDYFNQTFIVSMYLIGEQVQIASIDWPAFKTNSIRFPGYDSTIYTTGAWIWPAGTPMPHEADGSATKMKYLNRIQFTFMYSDTWSSSGEYEGFDNFGDDIVDTFNDIDNIKHGATGLVVVQSDLHLVQAWSLSFANYSVLQQYTVSFKTAAQRNKMLAIMNDPTSDRDFDSDVTIYKAASVGGGSSDDDKKKSNTALIAGVIVAVIVVIVIVAVVAKSAGGGGDGNKGEDYVAMNSGSQV